MLRKALGNGIQGARRLAVRSRRVWARLVDEPPTSPTTPRWTGIPWGPGYIEARNAAIADILSDPGRLERFAEGRVPEVYGRSLDERCVEYPWLLSRLDAAERFMLDAGSALNHRFVLDHPSIADKQLHVLTLAPEPSCFWDRGISYLFHDLRDIPVRDGTYDVICSISTLEHVGMDNTRFSGSAQHAEHDPDQSFLALRELRRVLKPGGRLLFSVPYGAGRSFASFRQHDRESLGRLIQAFEASTPAEESYYRYTNQGWRTATAEECAGAHYVEWVAEVFSSGVWPDPVPIEADGAAAARAVACIVLTKPGAASAPDG